MNTNTILVVDDNDSGRYLKVRALRKAGFDVKEAATAKAAFEHVDKLAIQVAVLDVKLPDMHGFELCKQIKARHPSIGVLQTSATFTTPDDRVAGLEYGADAYLVEPMEETELVAVVRALLRIRQAEAASLAMEARFSQFAQASPDVLWVYDPDHSRFEYISPSFRELFARDPQEAVRDHNVWISHVDADHREAFMRMIRTWERDEQAPVEYRILRSDGSSRWVRDQPFILPNGTGGRRLAGLARDITQSKEADRQRDLLIGELNHRVKNTLAIVQSLATHTMHQASSPAAFESAFTSRLHALAHAHDMLTSTLWLGMTMQQVVEAALSPFSAFGETLNRITATGPKVWIAANTAVTLTLAFHELATNASKYGALSTESGHVSVTWTAEPACNPEAVHLRWIESGGPLVKEPARRGFGSVLVEKVLAFEAHGESKLLFNPAGLEFHCHLPLTDKVKLQEG